MTHNLPKPCIYTPFDTGKYAFSIGLSPLSRKFGNGESDGHLFQLDEQFDVYRANKNALRGKTHLYSGVADTCDPEILAHTFETIVHILQREHPDLFDITRGDDTHILECKLTGDRLVFDANWVLTESTDYASTLEALAHQIQEDFAIVEVKGVDSDQLVACHVCTPSGWDASAQLSRSFTEIHEPIPEMESIKEASANLLFQLTRPGSNQRFVWGITYNDILDSHPAAVTPERLAPFNPDTGELYLRVERQVIRGLAEVESFLFTIRTYIYPIREMKPELRAKLKEAVLSQSPATLKYKGLENSLEIITEWIS